MKHVETAEYITQRTEQLYQEAQEAAKSARDTTDAWHEAQIRGLSEKLRRALATQVIGHGVDKPALLFQYAAAWVQDNRESGIEAVDHILRNTEPDDLDRIAVNTLRGYAPTFPLLKPLVDAYKQGWFGYQHTEGRTDIMSGDA